MTVTLIPLVDSHAHLDMEEFDRDRGDVLERAGRAGVRAILCPLELTGARPRPPGGRPGPSLDPPRRGCPPPRSPARRRGDARAARSPGRRAGDPRGRRDRPRFPLQPVPSRNPARDLPRPARPGEQGGFTRHRPQPERRGGDPPRHPGGTLRRGRRAPLLHRVVGDRLGRARGAASSSPSAASSRSPRPMTSAKWPRTCRSTAILVETDAPYLAPVPHRGKRNEPAFVVETARVLADLRGEPLERFAAATSDNFFRLFGGLADRPTLTVGTSRGKFRRANLRGTPPPDVRLRAISSPRVSSYALARCSDSFVAS